MTLDKKLMGEERRKEILTLLKQTTAPMTGGDLAQLANVSRQVIVQDIALLKARNEPILATPQGYIYMHSAKEKAVKRVIACCHTIEQTEEELNILVDHGVKVLDVMVEHPTYGELRGSLMLQTREDVRQFLNKIKETDATLLSSLTGGVHLHTVEAPTEQMLKKACQALSDIGILLKEQA